MDLPYPTNSKNAKYQKLTIMASSSYSGDPHTEMRMWDFNTKSRVCLRFTSPEARRLSPRANHAAHTQFGSEIAISIRRLARERGKIWRVTSLTNVMSVSLLCCASVGRLDKPACNCFKRSLNHDSQDVDWPMTHSHKALP